MPPTYSFALRLLQVQIRLEVYLAVADLARVSGPTIEAAKLTRAVLNWDPTEEDLLIACIAALALENHLSALAGMPVDWN